MMEKLTDDEREFLEKYRQLSDYEQGYVAGMLEAKVERMHTEKRKGFRVCQEGEDDAGRKTE